MYSSRQSPPPSDDLMTNFMDALSSSNANHSTAERRASAPPSTESTPSLSSPESHPSALHSFEFNNDEDMLSIPGLMFPPSSFVDGKLSSATVVSSDPTLEIRPGRLPPSVITTSRSSSKKPNTRKLSAAAERRLSLPSPLVVSPSLLDSAAATSNVPEFLCHLLTMLKDPALTSIISWCVPENDEPDHLGGGIQGMGKIVVNRPDAIQDFVLGKYYRHSKYASFREYSVL